MIWNVIRNQSGELELVDINVALPSTVTIEAVTANPNYLDPESPEKIRAEKLKRRQEMVDSIVVTTRSGKSFDGDETSQGRMARAIIALNAAGITETTWVLATNIPTLVTIQELTEALMLAGAEQTRIWVIN